MFRRYKPLLVTAFVICSVSLFWGCSQPDDIFTPVFRTEISLSPERLPTNPPGMIYSLWAANNETGDTVYIGKFGYNYKTVQFMDENSTPRADTNLFVLNDDLFSYTHLFVSIDTLDFDTTDPGPIMLIDVVTVPTDDLIELEFYLADSLWGATTRFNMETVSDNDRYADDGHGVWFCDYRMETTNVQDTFALTDFKLDSVILHDIGGKTDTSSIVGYENYSVDTVDVILDQDSANNVFNLDTIQMIKVNFDFVYYTDADSPWVVYEPRLTYSVGILQSVTYDIWSQEDYGLIDYSALGWKYKGWVVSPDILPAVLGEITPPAWLYKTGDYTSIPGEEGGLITTGTFARINAPDDSNPYARSQRIPPFPGEDFLENLPVGFDGNLLPDATGNVGTVFITLEPENFVTDTTNFPLFVMIWPLPANRSDITQASVGIPMRGWVQSNDPYHGFPRVTASIKRF
ncbi:MAG: hypothetical protein OEW00_03700 [candidate division Zixibacteria bacterium]|nr:hypothetical protein [candidate division Zixibacteria bacterium]